MNYILKELKYGTQNYKSLNVILQKGKGVLLTDVNNKTYFDFLSGCGSVNQGHCHPRLVKALHDQSQNLTMTSRAFHNNKLGLLCEFMSSTFKYDKYLPMNTDVEAVETAIKLARKWGYEKKNVPTNAAVSLFCHNSFWRLSPSTDHLSYENFTKGFQSVEFNNLVQLEHRFKYNPNIVSFMAEPIQGEAGVIIPHKNYLKKAYKLCKKYNVLMIADEIQTGLGRTGKMLASKYDDVKADILILGKSLSGGMMPVSGILSNKDIMDVFIPRSGSTNNGNPLSCHLTMEAVKIIIEEDLTSNSYNLGKYFREELVNLNIQNVKDIRGNGLMNAIEFYDKAIAKKSLSILKTYGLLTQITQDKTIRLTPPLVITKAQIDQSLEIIEKIKFAN